MNCLKAFQVTVRVINVISNDTLVVFTRVLFSCEIYDHLKCRVLNIFHDLVWKCHSYDQILLTANHLYGWRYQIFRVSIFHNSWRKWSIICFQSRHRNLMERHPDIKINNILVKVWNISFLGSNILFISFIF